MKNIATVGMTKGQAFRIAERFQARYKNDCSDLPKDVVQAVSDEEMEGLITEMIQPLRVRVERRLELALRAKAVRMLSLPEVTSNGKAGSDWVMHFAQKKYPVVDYAKQVLTIQHEDGKVTFVGTNGVTYKPVVIPGDCFTDDERTTENIRSVGASFKLITPPAELACILRDALTNEQIREMCLWLIPMHDPIEDADGNPSLLGVSALVAKSYLIACLGYPTKRWNREYGFVFLSPQH